MKDLIQPNNTVETLILQRSDCLVRIVKFMAPADYGQD